MVEATPRPDDAGSAEQFRLLADHVPALIASYDAATRRCRYANKAYAQAFGWDEAGILGRTFAEIIGEEAAREIAPHVDRVLTQREAVAYERRRVDRDGTSRWLEVHLLPDLGVDGQPRACFVLISDISKYRLAEIAVRESEDRLAKFMQASVEGIAFHRRGLVTDVNPPLLAMTGYTAEEMIGRHVLSFIAPEHVARVQQVMSAGDETRYELSVLCRDGSALPVEFIVRTMWRHGEKLRMTIVRDMRDRHEAQARIHHLAHHDTLTGLPNRHAFMERLQRVLDDAAVRGQTMALLFIDPDHFKRINDSLGHLAGDGVLVHIGERLTEILRSTDLVARYGGDEFMVLLSSLSGREDAEQVADKLLQALEAPLEIDGHPLSVAPSIGVAMFPDHGREPVELIQHADTAMYVAKSRGRARCQFFEPAMASRALAAMQLETQLARALTQGELALLYQPKRRCGDRQLVGVEALIRWHHPDRGLLSPDDFIGLAEERRLMHALGDWILRRALRDLKSRQDAHQPVVPVAVNVSGVEFHASDFVQRVTRALREIGVDGRWLELELTERVVMDDIGIAGQVLADLKALGVRIAIDDFGTGYSSLGHLKDLPIDRLKIDRSFVRDLPGDPGALAVARAIIQLAHSLGLVVTAEGVETRAQADALGALGCHELQGLLIGVPTPAARWPDD
jgi:diguanylate cyclase (GGDEF)-like protein/PAS domain S-box-containing protein